MISLVSKFSNPINNVRKKIKIIVIIRISDHNIFLQTRSLNYTRCRSLLATGFQIFIKKCSDSNSFSFSTENNILSIDPINLPYRLMLYHTQTH